MKEEPQITLPDFEEWSEKLVESGTVNDVYTGKVMLNSFPDRLEEALKQAFNQGESYGIFKGYNAGYTRGYNEGFVKGQDSAQILRNIINIVGGK